MKQVMLVLSDAKFSKKLSQSISSKYSIEVHEKLSSSEAISFLEILPYFNLIIANDVIGKDQTVQKIKTFIDENKEHFSDEIKFIILNKANNPFFKNDYQVSDDADLLYLTEYAGFALGLEKEKPVIKKVEVPPVAEAEPVGEKTTVFQMPSKAQLSKETTSTKIEVPKEEYSELDITFLKSTSDVMIYCDLYSRIKKSDGYEYTLKINGNKTLPKEEIEKLINRGIRQFWVKTSDYEKFNPEIIKQFIKFFLQGNHSPLERLSLLSSQYEILLKLIKDNKLDQQTVEIIKASLPTFDYFIKTFESINSFQNLIHKKKVSYGLVHGLLSCILMHQLFKKFEWSKDITPNKLNYLSFFHDMSLHSDRLIKIHHHYFSEKDKLTPEELATIEKHADSMAKGLEVIVKAPKELVAYLREHHGAMAGTNILETLNTRLSPLAKSFMVIENFSTLFLDKLETSNEILSKDDINEILEAIKVKFEKPGYSETFIELKKYLETENNESSDKQVT
jgi:hypothetical protein